MPISETGIWVDDSGEVVYEQPEGRSTQIVAKGGEISDASHARLEQLGKSLPDDEEDADEDKTVTTDDVEPKKTRAKKQA